MRTANSGNNARACLGMLAENMQKKRYGKRYGKSF